MFWPFSFPYDMQTLFWSMGAFACLAAFMWLQRRRGRFGAADTALIIALGLSALWLLTGAAMGLESGAVQMAESLRNLAWIFALYRLFGMDGRLAAVRPVRPMLAALAFVELLQVATFLFLSLRQVPVAAGFAFHSLVSLRLLVAVGGLVLVHNLYAGAAQQSRLLIRWPATALALLCIVDLHYYAIAYLSGGSPQLIGLLRGLLGLPAAGLLALGAVEKSENLRFQPSRAVTFQTVSLLLIGGYLTVMVAVAQWLAFVGRDNAALLQISFVTAIALAGILTALSPRLRGWLRVTLIKNLFQHRYDYRAEWLRFTRTIGLAGFDSAPLNQRVIRAVGDITDSPAGLLLVPGESGGLELAARWNWPMVQVPAMAMNQVLARRYEMDGYITELDVERATGRASLLPEWLLTEPQAWALVPLLHFDRLEGMVVLARPAHVRRLDWEDFDLLRVVGRQLASYLAENAGQAALAEAARFDDFHRRIAFVMHDIKNLASQLGLLARNAELHAENPEFRADMLVTLRNSTDKLNALVARLSRYGPGSIDALVPIRANAIARSVVDQLKPRHPLTMVDNSQSVIMASPDSLEQVLLHLVQNAIDVSPAGAPVMISVGRQGMEGVIEVLDSGPGMSAEFIRSRLYRPFDSTKPGGFGIGAYEARELVRAMGGRLEVESREGLGTRFAVVLPLAQPGTAQGLNSIGFAGAKVA